MAGTNILVRQKDLIAGSGISITPDTTSGNVTIAATNTAIDEARLLPTGGKNGNILEYQEGADRGNGNDVRLLLQSALTDSASGNAAPAAVTTQGVTLTGDNSLLFSGNDSHVTAVLATDEIFAADKEWTIDFWMKPIANSSEWNYILTENTGDWGSHSIGLTWNKSKSVLEQDTGGYVASVIKAPNWPNNSIACAVGEWHFVAVEKQKTATGWSLNYYLNGAIWLQVAFTGEFVPFTSDNPFWFGGKTTDSGRWFKGEANKLRVTAGARYGGKAFAVPDRLIDYAAPAGQPVWIEGIDRSRLLPENPASGDIPCYNATATTGGGNDVNTKVLLHFDELPFADTAAGNASPAAVTNSGVTLDTENFKFGTASAKFANSSNNLKVAVPQAQMMASPWLADCWFKVDDGQWNEYCRIFTQDDEQNGGWTYYLMSSNRVGVWVRGITPNEPASAALTPGDWHYAALVYYNAKFYGFIDGVRFTVQDGSAEGFLNYIMLGKRIQSTSYSLRGNIDEFRFQLLDEAEIGKWTGTTIPVPTAPYSIQETAGEWGKFNKSELVQSVNGVAPNESGNVILDASTIIDNSRLLPETGSVSSDSVGNPVIFKAISRIDNTYWLCLPLNEDTNDRSTYDVATGVYGTVNIVSNAPSSPGGSAFFNGSSCLHGTLPAQFGASDFTVRLWMMAPTISSSSHTIFSTRRGNQTDADTFGLLCTTEGRLFIYSNGDITSRTDTPFALQSNVWYHVAVVRKSGVLTIYVNGEVYNSATFTNSLTRQIFGLGASWTGSSYSEAGTVYLTSLDVLNYAAYDEAFTTPAYQPGILAGMGYAVATDSEVTDMLSAAGIDESRLVPTGGKDGDILGYQEGVDRGNNVNTKLLLQPATSDGLIVDQAVGNAAPVDITNSGNVVIEDNALVFTGTNSLLIPANALGMTLGGNNEFTIDIEFQLDSVKSDYATLYGSDGGGSGYQGALYFTSGGDALFTMSLGPDTTGWTLGTKHRITIERWNDNGTWKTSVYRNGSFLASSTSGMNILSDYVFPIGSNTDSTNRNFIGKIWAFRISNKAEHHGVSFAPRELPFLPPAGQPVWAEGIDRSRLLPDNPANGDIPCFDATATVGGGNDANTKLLIQPETSNNQILDQAAGNAAPVSITNSGNVVIEDNALVFTGTNSLLIPANALGMTLGGNNEFTIDIEFQLDSVKSDYATLYGSDGGSSSSRGALYFTSGGAAHFTDSLGPSTTGWTLGTKHRITIERWNDNGTWKTSVYRNGSFLASSTSGMNTLSDYVFPIGSNTDSTNRNFIGKIWAFRISNKAIHGGQSFTPDALPWTKPQTVGEWSKLNKSELAMKSDFPSGNIVTNVSGATADSTGYVSLKNTDKYDFSAIKNNTVPWAAPASVLRPIGNRRVQRFYSENTAVLLLSDNSFFPFIAEELGDGRYVTLKPIDASKPMWFGICTDGFKMEISQFTVGLYGDTDCSFEYELYGSAYEESDYSPLNGRWNLVHSGEIYLINNGDFKTATEDIPIASRGYYRSYAFVMKNVSGPGIISWLPEYIANNWGRLSPVLSVNGHYASANSNEIQLPAATASAAGLMAAADKVKLDALQQAATYINTATDFDTYKTAGSYFLKGAVHTNGPLTDSYAGTLVVVALAELQYATQYFTQLYTNKTFVRTYAQDNSAWSAWRRIIVDTDLATTTVAGLMPGDLYSKLINRFTGNPTMPVQDRADLNTLTENGFYTCALCTNAPKDNQYLYLMVVRYGTANVFNWQFACDINTGIMYSRRSRSNTTEGTVWDSWRRLLTDVDITEYKDRPGYFKLPGGIIVQWGAASNITTDGSTQITFPVAFPNAFLIGNATAVSGNASASGVVVSLAAVLSTGMTLLTKNHPGNGNDINVHWLAIGY